MADVSFSYMFHSNELLIEATVDSDGVTFNDVLITDGGKSFVQFDFDGVVVRRRALPLKYDHLEDLLVAVAYEEADRQAADDAADRADWEYEKAKDRQLEAAQ